MKIKDFKIGMVVNSPTKGEGIIIKITKRTITTKFKYSTSKLTLNSSKLLISDSDL